MATAFAPVAHAEDRNVLRDITWETYLKLNGENQSRGTRMAYFEGELEIMTVGWPHEMAKGRVNTLFQLIAEALEVEYEDSGNHTFRHKRKRIGFEADLSYYVTNLDAIRGRTKVNLDRDPPPDLVVEIDISRNSEGKLLMYAALGIREVWRCEGATIRFYRLSGGGYRTATKSAILPGVSASLLTKLLAESERMSKLTWLARIRAAAPKPDR